MTFLLALFLVATPFTAHGTPAAADTSAASVVAVAAAPGPEAPAPSAAPAVEDLSLRFSGQIFTRYGWNFSGTEAGRDFNSFSVDRFYLTVRGAVSDKIHFRGTTDIKQASADARLGSVVVLKYAYFDWAATPWLTLQTGIVPTGWANHVNKVWGYRALAASMGQQQKFFGTADMGAAALFTLPADLGEAGFHVLNGTGFRAPETDRFKDVAFDLVLTPFARLGAGLDRLQLGAHTSCAREEAGETRTIWSGLAAYVAPRLTVGVDVESLTAGEARSHGVSAFGRVDVSAFAPVRGLSLLGRIDRFDAGTGEASAAHLRTIFGVAYQPAPHLTLILDHQQVTGDAATFARYDGTFTRTDGRLYLHAVVNY